MWNQFYRKFFEMNFTATEILREIIFGKFKGSNTAIAAFLEALNFDFRENLPFESVKNLLHF